MKYSNPVTPLLSVAAVVVGSVCASAPAYSQVVVTASTTAPSTNVVSSFAIDDSTEPSGYQWRYSAGSARRDLGEIFYTTAALDLQGFTLQLQSGMGAGAKNAEFTLQIIRFSSLSPVTVQEVVGSYSGTFGSTAYVANTYLTFDLSSENVKLEANATYGFLLSFNEEGTSRAISFQSATVANVTTEGRRFESADGVNFTISGTSLEFYVQATPSTIPEPSAAAFAGGLVALGAGFAMRRRPRISSK